MAPLKTYSHLAAARRLPTDYEIVTSRLLYYPDKGGFEVRVPLSHWYEEHGRGSPLRCRNWERFVDPRETTYASYTALQKTSEAHVGLLLATADDGTYDQGLAADWVDTLEAVLAPVRYPAHGLQMVAAYVGQMAPSGRIVVTAAFQCADEIRRLQRIAWRMGQLRRLRPGFGDAGRRAWEDAPAWQPLRRTIEELLVTYDWGEALVALNGCVKPLFDALLLGAFARIVRERGDFLLAQVLLALEEDAAWHRAWTKALLALASADEEEGAGVRAAIAGWRARWLPRAAEAIAGLAPIVGAAVVDRAVNEGTAKSAQVLEGAT